MSERRNIVLGVTGSIAAYKAAELTSQLSKQELMCGGDDRRCASFHHAAGFQDPVPPSGGHGLYDEEEGWKPTHIELADEADLLLVAPATANVLAKLAHGLADDALTCIALALNPKAKILLAPAMNGKMWLHPATQQNVTALQTRGAEIIGPEKGLLSCGYEGLGRLWPVDAVARRAVELLS